MRTDFVLGIFFAPNDGIAFRPAARPRLLLAEDAGVLLGSEPQGVRERAPRRQFTRAGAADVRLAAREPLHHERVFG